MLSGAVLALALPKPGWWPASWIGLALLLAAVYDTRPRFAALLGLIAGVVYFGIILLWMTLFGGLPWMLLVLMQAMFFAAFAAVVSIVGSAGASPSRYVLVPAAWTAMQWLRSLGTYGFTWGSFAHTQANVMPLIQIASVTGPWGIDFIVCLANLALADLIFKRRVWPTVAAALLVGVTIACGHLAIGFDSHGRQLKMAVVQGMLTHDVNPSEDYTPEAFRVYRGMTLQAAEHRPDLIVWPETTLTQRITDSGWGRQLAQLAIQAGSVLMVGGYDAPEDPAVAESYNGVHVYGADGHKLGVYHKVHLVPYGEFVPMRERMPFLKNYGIRNVDVLPGKSHNLIYIEPGKVGVAICFESLFPQISRIEALNGAGVLFVVTNDSWFGHSQAAMQHFMMAKLRAVETRRWVVRAASTGVSAVIDPQGRAVQTLDVFRSGTLIENVRFGRGLTPYVRFGDWFAYVCTAVTLIALIFRAAGWHLRRFLR
jgi:apolipoprotein N-acyltransferase